MDKDKLEKIEMQLQLLTLKVDIIYHKLAYDEQLQNQKLAPGSEDDLFEEAKRIVVKAGKASTSLLQRRLRIGFARACRLLDLLEEDGIVGPADGAKPRDVLIND